MFRYETNLLIVTISKYFLVFFWINVLIKHLSKSFSSAIRLLHITFTIESILSEIENKEELIYKIFRQQIHQIIRCGKQLNQYIVKHHSRQP